MTVAPPTRLHSTEVPGETVIRAVGGRFVSCAVICRPMLSPFASEPVAEKVMRRLGRSRVTARLPGEDTSKTRGVPSTTAPIRPESEAAGSGAADCPPPVLVSGVCASPVESHLGPSKCRPKKLKAVPVKLMRLTRRLPPGNSEVAPGSANPMLPETGTTVAVDPTERVSFDTVLSTVAT